MFVCLFLFVCTCIYGIFVFIDIFVLLLFACTCMYDIFVLYVYFVYFCLFVWFLIVL